MSIRHLGLYARFFLLFTLTTLLLVAFVILGVFTLSENEAQDIVMERQDQLYEMMTNVAVIPIDIEKLTEEAKKNRVNIQINAVNQSWKTSHALPHQNELLPNSVELGSLYFAKHKTKYYLLAQHNETWIIITSQIANLIVYPNWLVFWPWCVVILILFVSYRLLAMQLKPIKDAIKSAQQISEGNFNYKIAQHPKNDLAELTHGLDKMAQELKKLFSAKDDLLLAVSHELRSPMARMKVSFALLEQNDIVQRLDKDVNHMDMIIAQLLESARLQQSNKALHLDTYFLPSFISETLEEHENHDRLLITTTVPELAINIDNGRIKFVLRNLINNAITHAGDDKNICIKVDQTSALVLITVKDQGRGIDEKYLPDIFEPFTSGSSINNRSNKGLGLGLYLCKRIAIAHGGDLTVVSKQGEGSAFTLHLPFCS